MDLGRILPLLCITCAAGFGMLMYIALVMTYRRQHESAIERKQRERRELLARQAHEKQPAD